ncbi:MAG: efflux RND transporter periplasmic adaptor subunit [Chromatiales bacterium]|nr:efflux RND transporter periplasmic adaptor subunit [Chromatiales bacterium]
MKLASAISSRPWIISLLIGLALVAWLASGMIGRSLDETPTPAVARVTAPQIDLEALPVQVRAQEAELVGQWVTVFGRSAPARTVELRAETDGRVEYIGLGRGERAGEGKALLRLDLRDRAARLAQVEAEIRLHEEALRGQLSLRESGFVSRTQLAETEARLEASRAELTRAELDLANREIRTPFTGVLLDRFVEIGDFVRAGDVVATWVDNTSIIVTGSVTEREAGGLSVGAAASAKLITGQEARGVIRFIAPVAEEATRTFRIELEIPNPDGRLPSGVTAEMRIPVGERLAHRLAPSLLTLDSDGRIGVKTINDDYEVVFNEVEIVRSEAAHVWVAGLPKAANVIVVGQGFASTGQRVAPSWVEPDTALAERPQ